MQEDTDPSAATEGPSQPSLPPALPLQQKGIKTIPKAYSQTSTLRHLEAEKDNIKLQTVRNMLKNEKGGELKNVSSNFSMREEKTKTSWGGRCSVCKGTGALMSSPQQSLEGGRELPTADKSVEFLRVDYVIIRKMNDDDLHNNLLYLFAALCLVCCLSPQHQ